MVKISIQTNFQINAAALTATAANLRQAAQPSAARSRGAR